MMLSQSCTYLTGEVGHVAEFPKVIMSTRGVSRCIPGFLGVWKPPSTARKVKEHWTIVIGYEHE